MEALSTEADDIREVSLQAAKIRAKYMPFLELLPAVGLVGVLGVGGLRVIDGSMTVGELVAFNFFDVACVATEVDRNDRCIWAACCGSA